MHSFLAICNLMFEGHLCPLAFGFFEAFTQTYFLAVLAPLLQDSYWSMIIMEDFNTQLIACTSFQTLFDGFTVASLTIYLIHSEIFFLSYASGFFKKMQIMISQAADFSAFARIWEYHCHSVLRFFFLSTSKERRKLRELEKSVKIISVWTQINQL